MEVKVEAFIMTDKLNGLIRIISGKSNSVALLQLDQAQKSRLKIGALMT